jgi:hypothetical protein
MKLTTPTLRRLRALLTSINSKVRLPVLTHLHIHPINETRVLLAASDLENQFHWPLQLPEPTSLTEPTSCSIEWFLALTRSLPKDGWIEFCQLNHHMRAFTSTGTASLCPQARIDHDQFPPFETTGFNLGGWLNPKTLHDAIASSAFMSTDETRYVLNGVFFASNGTTVATNGRYLGFTPPAPGTSLPASFIMPPRALKCLTSPLLPEDDKPIPFWLPQKPDGSPNGNWSYPLLLAQPFDNCLLKHTLIDGQYPNYAQVIPKSEDMTTFVTLTHSAPQTLLFHQRSTRAETTTTFHLHADHSVTASVKASGSGPATALCEPFPAGTWKGTSAPFDICFDTFLLLPCLEFSGTYLRLRDSNSPMLGGQPDGRQTVLMPMRLNN